MATLYELDARLDALLEKVWQTEDGLIDKESGEVLDNSVLDDLQMEFTEKVDNIGCYIKNLCAEAEMYEREAEWQAHRAKRAKAKAESLRKYLMLHMEEGKKFSSPHCEMKWSKSEATNIFDISLIPKEYIKVKTEEKPDKTAIKKAIKAGATVPGAELVRNVNLTIK